MEAERDMWFAEWFDSSYYHILYSDRDEQEAERFISRLLGHLDLPSQAVVLDLACGKGRHSRTMAAEGYAVTGVDLSPQSIEYCREMAVGSDEYAVADMRRPIADDRFHAIFNLFTSFGYFDSTDDNLSTLRSIKTGLCSDGRFIIDFLNVGPVLETLPVAEVKTRAGIDFHIHKSLVDGVIVKQIDFQGKEGGLAYTERLQALTLADFKQFVADAGLQIDEVFGDYQLGSFDAETSDRLIIVGSHA